MKTSTIVIMAALLLCVVGLNVQTSDAATSFSGSTVTAVDESKGTVTFRTKEGESWTLPVSDPELIKKKQVAQGDQVSIEIDLDDRITKIAKPSDDQPSAQSAPREGEN